MTTTASDQRRSRRRGGRPKSSVATNRLAPSAIARPIDDADGDQDHRLAHHQPQHVLPLRAERHADADLVGAARDVVRHQPEESDRRQQQRQRRRTACRPARTVFSCSEPPLDLLDLRRHVRQRQVRIDLPDRPRESRRSTPAGSPAVRTSNDGACQRASADTARTSSAAPRRGRCRTSRRAARRRSRAGRSSRGSMPKRWPIGFSFGKVLARGRLVDDRDLRRRRVVAIGEAAPEHDRNAHHLEEVRRDDETVDAVVAGPAARRCGPGRRCSVRLTLPDSSAGFDSADRRGRREPPPSRSSRSRYRPVIRFSS